MEPSFTDHLSFSVLLPVYDGDDPNHFDTAITSVVEQTHPPDEILVVRDATLSESHINVLQRWMDEYENTFGVHVIGDDQGLGNALREGVKKCANDYIARMDADDISVDDRFEKQLSFLQTNPAIDIVGGYVSEFDTDPEMTHATRTVPVTHGEIEQCAKFRCPMNHPTVMFRREAVLDAGNYRSVSRLEDYDLWVRMLMNGSKFANIPEVLLKMRAGDELYARRGGYAYACQEIKQQLKLYRRGFTDLTQFAFNTVTRAGVRVVPGSVRKHMYLRFRELDK